MSFIKSHWKWVVVVVLAGGVFLRFKLASVPVEAYTVEKGEVNAEIMGTGTLEARVKTTISPRIQERLAEVLVDQNDFVVKDQVLARLDDGELRRQVEVAEATLAAARATLERVRVDEARAEAVDQQARQDYQRVADLLATKVSSQADMDKATEQLRVADSDLKRARAAIEEARQQVTTAEKTLAYHLERLGFAQIRSPYDGLVTRRDRDPGGVVVPGSSLLQVISTNEIWVSAWVDETASAGLAPGQTARVIFRSEPGKRYVGKVARLGRETDRETREFLVDVNVENLPPNWTLGQRAEVLIVTGSKREALAVPTRFVRWKQGTPGVFVDQGGRAAWRGLKLGLQGRELVEVTDGLSAGERVVRGSGVKTALLQEGQKIAAR